MNQQAIECVENLNCLCNKLGGIDTFDQYYADFYQKINVKTQIRPLESNKRLRGRNEEPH